MPQENVEIARRGYDAFNRGDFEAMVEDFAPDCEYVTAAVITGVGSVYRGLTDTDVLSRGSSATTTTPVSRSTT